MIGLVGQFLFPFPLVSRDFELALREDGAFEDARAAKPPGGDDHLVDQKGFDGIDGGETVAEGCRVGFKFVGAFGGDEDLRGGEAVREGVGAGAGFAVRGAGSGAELGVAAIGFLLFFRRHGMTW